MQQRTRPHRQAFDELPAGWTEHVTKTPRRRTYYAGPTGRTQWSRPAAAVPAVPAPVEERRSRAATKSAARRVVGRIDGSTVHRYLLRPPASHSKFLAAFSCRLCNASNLNKNLRSTLNGCRPRTDERNRSQRDSPLHPAGPNVAAGRRGRCAGCRTRPISGQARCVGDCRLRWGAPSCGRRCRRQRRPDRRPCCWQACRRGAGDASRACDPTAGGGGGGGGGGWGCHAAAPAGAAGSGQVRVMLG